MAAGNAEPASPAAARGNVVVTGASSGIGRASARLLAGQGFHVFAGVRKDADAESVRGEGSERLEPLTIDVADEESVRAATAAVEEKVGEHGLAGLVNNAGISVPGPLETLSLDSLRRQLEVNLVGQVAVTQALLPALRVVRGRIVFVSSIGGRLALPFNSAYHASKYGIEAIGDALRLELRSWGIEVILIEPGSIATGIWEKGQSEGEQHLAEMTTRGRELYGDKVEALQKIARREEARGIPPERVAEVISKALTVDRPRTRYLVGRDAKINARLRKILPDRIFDRLVAREVGLK